jgi:group I intron endonuclease
VWTRRETGEQYVGETTRPIKERIKDHRKKSSKCRKLRDAIREHGIGAFDIEHFEWVDPWDLAYIEMFLIEELETLSPNGYNLRKGGGGGYGSMSEELKKINSEAQKGNKNRYGKTHTEAAKQKMSKAVCGKKNHNYGKTGELSSSSKKIYRYDLEGNYIDWFGSCGEAGRKLNIDKNSISKCACGKRTSAGKFKWSYNFVSTNGQEEIN